MLLVVCVPRTDEFTEGIAVNVRDSADRLAKIVDALASDTGPRSIATGRDQLEAASAISHKSEIRSGEADNEPSVVDTSRTELPTDRPRGGGIMLGNEIRREVDLSGHRLTMAFETRLPACD